MADTRDLILPRKWSRYEIATAANGGLDDNTSIDNALLSIRNEFRTNLPGASYKVSDFFTWTGTSGAESAAFIVRNIVLNKEYMFILPRRRNSTFGVYTYYSIGNSSLATIWSKYIHKAGVTSYATGSVQEMSLMVFYNPDSTSSWDVTFDNATELTFTGGDFTGSPNTNPATSDANATTFFAGPTANKAPRGLIYYDHMGIVGARWCALFDSNTGWLRVDVTFGDASGDKVISIFGDFIVPDDPGDTAISAVYHQDIVADTQADMGTSATPGYIDTWDTTGSARKTYQVNALAFAGYSRDTYLSVGGNPKAKAVEIKLSTDLKGTFDQRCVTEVFPEGDNEFLGKGIQNPDADNPLRKESQYLAFFWKRDRVIFPSVLTTGLPVYHLRGRMS